MTAVRQQENRVDFHVESAPGPCSTWYKVFGDLTSNQIPVIVLHGGPGGTHDYLLSHKWLTENHGIPTIFYDSIGNGKSTRLPQTKGNEAFWTEQLFRDELDNLVNHLGLRERGFDLIGHSWGGMLGSAYASYKPKGLRRLVCESTPADMRDWVQAQTLLRSQLSQSVQDVLQRCEDEGRTDDKEYEEAMGVFYQKHLCKINPWPEEVVVTMKSLVEDPTVYGTMNGPSETYITGTLKTWQVTDRLHNVDIPVLLINGEDDEAQYNCVAPFFRELKKVKWVTIAGASHMAHVEQMDKYFKLVSDFLLEKGI